MVVCATSRDNCFINPLVVDHWQRQLHRYNRTAAYVKASSI